jgi:hypothetical protein
MQTCSFVVNETGHDWKPGISNFSHIPNNPTNISNVIIYADVTSTNPFAIKQVVVYWKNSTKTCSSLMYRYGTNPIQTRHEEDPLKNESNNPLFGYELGLFPTGENITYWVVAYDAALNSRKSNEQSFTVSTH